MNIVWEDKNQVVSEWFFYLNEISVAVTMKKKLNKKKRKTKAGSKERVLAVLI